MRLRILFASYTAATTGPTNSLLLLLKYLRQAHEVSVLMPGSGSLSTELERESIPFHSLPTLDRGSAPAIARLLTKQGTDLLYLNNTCGAMRNAALGGLLARVPHVSHVREMGYGKTWSKLGYLWTSASVLAVSRACAESIKRFVRQGRLHVAYNGVDFSDQETTTLSDDRRYARAACGLNDSAILLLSVSHLAPRKGQEYAIAAFAQLALRRPEAHLYLAGELDRDPEYVARLREQIRALDLEERVHLLGFRRDLGRICRGSDLFLHTALADPHPRSVIEAMAAGLPVVAFATDGVLETVDSGETGIIVPQRDHPALLEALDRLISDTNLRTQMGATGQRRAVEQFSAARSAARVDEIIQSVRLRPRRVVFARGTPR